ncbi:DUF2971 domain-containing protein [Klebsiella variicola]|uniref:DUF2971 domain-containing protein n=1 Tax=Klebsiella variicola TaxID=244366 RepID=UPI00103454CA|nr:DUF2971 domain-containing protein [Klebsiella variicola]
MNLCHYTNLHGFQGIVQSNVLWATHNMFLNDKTEFLHGIECASKAAASLESNIMDPGWQEYVKDYIKFKDQFNASNAYSLSFCKDDSDKLSQWRGYGGNQQGVCLVFDKDELINHLNTTNIVSFQAEGRFFEMAKYMFSHYSVEYVNPEESDVFKKAMEEVWTNTNSLVPNIGIENTAIPFILDLLVSYFKHPGFKEENEFRIVVHKLYADELLKFRVGSNSLIPYIEIGDFEKKLPFKKIVLGPSKDPDLLYKSVKMFLSKNNLKCEVDFTKVPYKI